MKGVSPNVKVKVEKTCEFRKGKYKGRFVNNFTAPHAIPSGAS